MSLKTPEINIIKLSEYKADSKKKEAPYIVIKDDVVRDLYHIGSVDIVGINKLGILAILDGAVPPTIDWAKHIYETDGAQQAGYTSLHKTQSDLLADMQNVLLEDFIKTNGKPKFKFTSLLIPKYVWAFQQLKKKFEEVRSADSVEMETASLSSVGSKSVVEEYGVEKQYADFDPYIEDSEEKLAEPAIEVKQPQEPITHSGTVSKKQWKRIQKRAAYENENNDNDINSNNLQPFENSTSTDEFVKGVKIKNLQTHNDWIRIINDYMKKQKEINKKILEHKKGEPVNDGLKEEYRSHIADLKELVDAHNFLYNDKKIRRNKTVKGGKHSKNYTRRH